jgi:hypothetical protein
LPQTHLGVAILLAKPTGACNMVKWECQMFYGDKLYSGHYWTDELSLARARRKVMELQRYHPAMRFVLTDWQKGSVVNLSVKTKESA